MPIPSKKIVPGETTEFYPLAGHIDCHRTTSNMHEDDVISFSLRDKASGACFFEGEMSRAEFADLITGKGHCEIAYRVQELEKIGKTREVKHETVVIPAKLRKDGERLTEAQVTRLLAPYEVDGWEGDRRDMANHHRRRQLPDGREGQYVGFLRWVDPKNETPEG